MAKLSNIKVKFTEYTMKGDVICETIAITLAKAIPCPRRQVGINSTVNWNPTFMAKVAKNLPVRNMTNWAAHISNKYASC